jgi:hypothetical protein
MPFTTLCSYEFSWLLLPNRINRSSPQHLPFKIFLLPCAAFQWPLFHLATGRIARPQHTASCGLSIGGRAVRWQISHFNQLPFGTARSMISKTLPVP